MRSHLKCTYDQRFRSSKFRLSFPWHYLSKQYLVIPFELTVLKRIVCESNVSGLTPPIFSHVTAEQQSVGVNGKWTVDNKERALNWIYRSRILCLIEIYVIVQLSSPVLARNQENTIPRRRRAIVVMFVARLPLASRANDSRASILCAKDFRERWLDLHTTIYRRDRLRNQSKMLKDLAKFTILVEQRAINVDV